MKPTCCAGAARSPGGKGEEFPLPPVDLVAGRSRAIPSTGPELDITKLCTTHGDRISQIEPGACWPQDVPGRPPARGAKAAAASTSMAPRASQAPTTLRRPSPRPASRRARRRQGFPRCARRFAPLTPSARAAALSSSTAGGRSAGSRAGGVALLAGDDVVDDDAAMVPPGVPRGAPPPIVRTQWGAARRSRQGRRFGGAAGRAPLMRSSTAPRCGRTMRRRAVGVASVGVRGCSLVERAANAPIWRRRFGRPLRAKRAGALRQIVICGLVRACVAAGAIVVDDEHEAAKGACHERGVRRAQGRRQSSR